MDVSPNELRKQTLQLLEPINQEIESIRVDARERGVSPFQTIGVDGQVRDLPTLLAAKAQCLNTLAILRGK